MVEFTKRKGKEECKEGFKGREERTGMKSVWRILREKDRKERKVVG